MLSRKIGVGGGVLICCLGAALQVAGTPPPSISWSHDLETAQKRAAKERKPILLDFSAEWCTPCKKMLQTTYKNKSVIDKSRKFVSVLLDYDKQKAVAKRYAVDSLPTLLFFSPDGKEVLRLHEFQDAKALLKQMNTVLKKTPIK